MNNCLSAQYRASIAAQWTIPRIVGGAIAALVALVALAILAAMFIAPGVAGVIAIATALGGPSVAIAVSGTLTIVMIALSTLFFGVCNCTPIKKKNETTDDASASSSSSATKADSDSKDE